MLPGESSVLHLFVRENLTPSSQPFFVAEAYTDVPGEYVRVEDTIKGCKELLEGRYDDVPDEAFWFVGTVEQALEKGKRLGGK